MFIKKGAMFGLDARIVLAIFGALSVISGAALYSAIQESKITAILTDIDELAKASEQYMLDTGSYISSTTGDDNLKTVDLLETSGLSGWAGPYISGYTKDDTYPDKLLVKNTNHYGIIRGVDTTWGSFTSADTKCSKSSSENCSVWIHATDFGLAYAQAIEKKIDGTVTPGTTSYDGNVRYSSAVFYVKKYVYDKTQAID
tara:strand:- start:613 stop:1212 length:600 start_codon:yes stop_codon:yes gene_type:complete